MSSTRAVGLAIVAILVVGSGVYLLRQPESEQFSRLDKAKNLINDGKFEEGLTIYTELSQGGMQTATYAIARIYSEGWGVPRDQLKAEELLRIFIVQSDGLCKEVPKISAAFQLMARDHTDPEMKAMWRRKALSVGYDDSKCPRSYIFSK